MPEPDAVQNIEKITHTAKQILSHTDTLYKGDTLKIKFKIPHSKDLAITNPDNAFFFLIYANNDPKMPSLIEWNTFAATNHLEIITDQTKANPWNATYKENQLIFTTTGKYKIELSDNLETDDGTPVETDSVYYIDYKKK